jgi:hypothetical protein
MSKRGGREQGGKGQDWRRKESETTTTYVEPAVKPDRSTVVERGAGFVKLPVTRSETGVEGEGSARKGVRHLPSPASRLLSPASKR